MLKKVLDTIKNLIKNIIIIIPFILVVLILNRKFFINGFKAVFNLAPNMDTLVALGSSAAFIYSLANVFTMLYSDISAAHNLLHNLYFEASAMILTLITVGKFMETRSKGKTKDALRKLMDLTPKTATVLRNGAELVIPADSVQVGDILVVRSGESVPVDGIVRAGSGGVDESAITGESVPARCRPSR